MPLLKNNRNNSLKANAGGITLFIAKLSQSRCLHSILAGVLAAVTLCLLFEGLLTARAVRIQETLAKVVGGRSASSFTQNIASLLPKQANMKFDAFNVIDAAGAVSEDVSGDVVPEALSIDQFRLAGTLPDIGAWITVDSATSLVLRDQEFNGYVLDSVSPGEVMLARDKELYPLYLTFYDPLVTKNPPPREAPEAQVPPQPEGGTFALGDIMAAGFNGNEGTIPRELVNELVLNPMDELRKVRLAPNENGEMTVQRIRSDSILYRLGLKRGDVLKGINDIPIKGGMDVVNVINSLMSSPRFDVSLNRGQEEGRLGYVVQ
ncbi:MAG: hypothetical protein LBI74_03360 [Synergistaceae bacterium]|jgi:hypothetical protein|nr:hypothetical protein [Synergistaceae bacterium]